MQNYFLTGPFEPIGENDGGEKYASECHQRYYATRHAESVQNLLVRPRFVRAFVAIVIVRVPQQLAEVGEVPTVALVQE